MNRHIYILITILSLCCLSCSKGSDAFNPAERNRTVVTAILGIDGAGDMGYNDLVAIGSAQAEEQRNLLVSCLSPHTIQEADGMICSWINHESDDARRRLLIVGSDCYESLVRKYADRITDSADERVLLLGFGDDIKSVHTVTVPYYGVCYKAGYLSAMFKGSYGMKERKSLVLCANPNGKGLIDGRDGFLDGYADYAGGHDVDVEYLDDGMSGFTMKETVYRKSFEWVKDYSLVFPLCGGSANGLYDFCHEYNGETGMVSIGFDTAKGFYGNVPFSVINRIDNIVCTYIIDWYDCRKVKPHQRYGLSEGGTDIIFSDGFPLLKDASEKIHNIAVDKESNR